MGIGKTRLAEEVGYEAHRRGWPVLWGRAYVQERAPYQLWADILRQAIQYDLWQELEKTISPSLAQPLITLLPEISHLLPQGKAFSTIYPEQEGLRLWEAMLTVLLAMSQYGPILIVLDDLQWADNSSCEFLAHLSRHLVDLPFLLLGTYRSASLPSTNIFHMQIMQLQRERLAEPLQLAPLTDSQIAAFVEHAPEHIIQHIQYLAAGNPFFAEELARVVDINKEEQSHNKHQGQVPPFTLPQTISALFEQRLKRLSNGCQQILRAAAVLGVSFSFHTIYLMQTKNGSPPDEDSILTQLEEAQEAELLTEQGSGTQVTYHFWHPLLLHHLYENISAARRVVLHRRAGQILQEQYMSSQEEGAALIVHHLIQCGGDTKQIAHYAEIAGQRAYTLSAYFDAEKYYRQAIHYLEEHLQKRSQIPSNEQLHIVSLQEYLADCLRVLNRPEEACQVYEQILASQRHADTSPNTLNVQLQALLWFHIARTWYNRGDMEQTLVCCEQAEELLHAASITYGGSRAYLFLQQSFVYWRMGLYAQALLLAEQTCSLFETMLQQPESETIDRTSPIQSMLIGDKTNLAHAYYHLGAISNSSGQFAEALVYLHKALTIFEQQNLRRSVAITCNDIADIYLRLADVTQAQAFLERSLQDAKYTGDLLLASYAIGNFGLAAMRSGQLVEAEAHFRRAITELEYYNNLIGKVLFSPNLAILLLEQGKVSDAYSTLCTALTLARRLHLVPYIGYVLIALGTMRLLQVITMVEPNETQVPSFSKTRIHLLKKARRALEYALKLEGLEADTRLDGEITLLEVRWHLNTQKTMYKQINLLRKKCAQSKLAWHLSRIERLHGNMLTTQGKYEQATSHFQQSMHHARHYNLAWEHARTLQCYGTSLLKQQTGTSLVQGREYLQEAQKTFAACHAIGEQHKVEQLLENASSPVEH
jgi:tetratricopeptide (TPR) repeat protein